MDARFWMDHMVSNLFAILAVTAAAIIIAVNTTDEAGMAAIAAVLVLSAMMPVMGIMHLMSAWRLLRSLDLPWNSHAGEQRRKRSLPPHTVWVWFPAGLGAVALLAAPEGSPVTQAEDAVGIMILASTAAGTACWAVTTRAALADLLERRRERRARADATDGQGGDSRGGARPAALPRSATDGK